MMNQPIVVTGATGYLGSRLSRGLRDRDYEVIELSSEQGDIGSSENESDWERAILECSPEVVYHLAACVGVEASWRRPTKFYQTNVMGTQRVLELCRKTDARLIYVSAYLYDSDPAGPVSENSPLGAANPYSHSKLLAEELCKFYSDNHNLKCIILRPFNVYGGKQGTSFLIPRILEQILGPNDVIQVNDLSPVRDYVYIDDVVSALVAILEYKVQFDVFNVGTGVGWSVKEVIGLMQEIWATKKTVISHEARRLNEISRSIAAVDKIRDTLGWNAQVSLEQGLREMMLEANLTPTERTPRA